MKKITLTLALLLAITVASFAQCGKTIVLTSAKTNHVDATGKLIASDDETVVIEIGKAAFSISVNGTQRMAGIVKTYKCNWPVPYKTGNSVIQGTMKKDGKDEDVMFTIDGKNGKIALGFEIKSMPNDRVRITPDKFIAKP
jgi:hypothetical protein